MLALARCRRTLANRLFVFDQTSKPVAQFATGSVQAAPNRTHRDLKDLADFLVSMTIEIFQDDHGAMFGAQSLECGLDQAFAFGPFDRQGRVSFRGLVLRIFSRGCTRARLWSMRQTNAPPPVTTEREIDRDSINPGVERAFSVKLIQLFKRAYERVLQDVLGILRGADQSQDRRVQPILVASDQRTECLGMARATRLHEAVVVKNPGHHSLSTLEVGRQFPKNATTITA